MTPIYGRRPWHDPCATLVPPRATLIETGTKWHDPGTTAVPPFEAFYREKSTSGTSGTTARMFYNNSGDVGNRAKKGRYLHLSVLYAKVLCRRATPKHPVHIWGYQEANELTA